MDVTPAFAWGVFLTLVGLIGFAVFGGITLLVGRRRQIVTRLERTTGVLQEAWVRPTRSFQTGQLQGYLPFGKYEYVVAGRTYTGRQITFQLHAFPTEEVALGMFGGKPGETIAVFYDRTRPSLSVLTPETPAMGPWPRNITVASAVAIVVGMVLATVGYTP